MEFCETNLQKYGHSEFMPNFNMDDEHLPNYLETMIMTLQREIETQNNKIESRIQLQQFKKSEHDQRMQKKANLGTNNRTFTEQRDTLKAKNKILADNLELSRDKRDESQANFDKNVISQVEGLTDQKTIFEEKELYYRVLVSTNKEIKLKTFIAQKENLKLSNMVVEMANKIVVNERSKCDKFIDCVKNMDSGN